jgi:hypothetical protein
METHSLIWMFSFQAKVTVIQLQAAEKQQSQLEIF